MASSILATLFMSTILLSFSSHNFVSSTHSMIEKVCSNAMDPKLCADFLQRQALISSSKNLKDVAKNLLQLGTIDVKYTLEYVQKGLNKPGIAPNQKAALLECTKSYDTVIATYASALKEVETDSTFDGTATYDLQVGCFDYMQPCIDALAAAKINDLIISNGNDNVHKFGSYAASTIGKL